MSNDHRVQIKPCKQNAGVVEWVAPADAEFYGVYFGKAGAFEWVADFANYGDAVRYAKQLAEETACELEPFIPEAVKPVNSEHAKQIDQFINGYIACLLWSSHDEPHDSLEEFELSDDAKKKCETECRAFIEENLAALIEYSHNVPRSAWMCAGHDFWLTRNRHGAGFWDRGLGVLGEVLTEAAHKAGARSAYINDNNEIDIEAV